MELVIELRVEPMTVEVVMVDLIFVEQVSGTDGKDELNSSRTLEIGKILFDGCCYLEHKSLAFFLCTW